MQQISFMLFQLGKKEELTKYLYISPIMCLNFLICCPFAEANEY